MSGLPANTWKRRFYSTEVLLKLRGCNVVNPADTIIARLPWLYWLVGYRLTLWYDMRLLRRCTHFTMVGSDWHRSRGARLERLKARQWGIKEMK